MDKNWAIRLLHGYYNLKLVVIPQSEKVVPLRHA